MIMGPDLPEALIGEFIDAVVESPEKASSLLAQYPSLLNALWIHAETGTSFPCGRGFRRSGQLSGGAAGGSSRVRIDPTGTMTEMLP